MNAEDTKKSKVIQGKDFSKDAEDFRDFLVYKIDSDDGEWIKIGKYLNQVAGNWREISATRLYKHIQNMLENAEGIRRFEIELIWKRAIYLTPLFVIFFTAFGGVFLKLDKITDLVFGMSGVNILLGIAFINACLCFFLAKMNSESQKWQENWEHHVDYLQEILGIALMRTCLRPQTNRFTIGRINTLISILMLEVWGSLIILLLSFVFKEVLVIKYIYMPFYSLDGWLLFLIGLVLMVALTLILYYLITGKNFLDTRQVRGTGNMYKRDLQDLDFDKLD